MTLRPRRPWPSSSRASSSAGRRGPRAWRGTSCSSSTSPFCSSAPCRPGGFR